MMKTKNSLIIASIFLLFLIPNFVFSQSSTVEELKNEITHLKQVINKLNIRIENLEKKFKNIEFQESNSSPTFISKSHKNLLSWHNKNNWLKIRDGMSERQVISILGNPTSVEDLGTFKTLFYRGEIKGSGFVSGNIKLGDDRVWKVNIPIF